MSKPTTPLNLTKIKTLPLAQRESLSRVEKIIVDPAAAPAPLAAAQEKILAGCAAKISAARKINASVMLIYGAHLVKNGAHRIVNALVERGWVTHLATNGAGVIHDWELAFLGRTEERVRENTATGTFGTWDETGRNIHLAILAGALRGEGFGASVGRFIVEDGATLPATAELEKLLRDAPVHPLAPARAELLQAMTVHKIRAGRVEVKHPHKDISMLATAFRSGVPFTVHPGIGYDIISNHPMFSGAAIGRGAGADFAQFGGAVERLDGGVVLSVGSAIMSPQVFEKSLSCVNNLRLQAGRKIVSGHTICVVDIADGGNWDWTRGEPPKDNPAYYLRFCKTFARMGGAMHYAQCGNVEFLHNLLNRLPKQQGSLPGKS